jgi:ATP-dependent exoDNAse (exonuclease V) beta subunit
MSRENTQSPASASRQTTRVPGAAALDDLARRIERHLLYVACTRTRDHLLVASVEPPSEFIDDIRV